jgi:hypothetical protein
MGSQCLSFCSMSSCSCTIHSTNFSTVSCSRYAIGCFDVLFVNPTIFYANPQAMCLVVFAVCDFSGSYWIVLQFIVRGMYYRRRLCTCTDRLAWVWITKSWTIPRSIRPHRCLSFGRCFWKFQKHLFELLRIGYCSFLHFTRTCFGNEPHISFSN